MGKYHGWRRFTTKRFIFSMIVLATTTWLKWNEKLGDQAYEITTLGVIAGHQAAELIAAWRGNKVDDHDSIRS